MNNKDVKKLELNITGMDCADCALHLEKSVSKLAGVRSVSVNFMQAKLKAEIESDQISETEITNTIKSTGYGVDTSDGVHENYYDFGEIDRKALRSFRKKLQSIDGIVNLKVDHSSNRLKVEHTLTEIELNELMQKEGLQPYRTGQERKLPRQSSGFNRRNTILTVLSGIFAVTGLILQQIPAQNPIIVPVFLMAIFLGGYSFVVKGFKEARHRTLGMNFLMSIAVLGAIIIGEWTEAAMVVFLFSLAQLLESYTIQRARNSIKSLINLAPNIALLKTGSETIEKPVEEIKIGEVILIKPGYRIPLDGEVVLGASRVNQAPITGESLPVEKHEGDSVFAGTLNQEGILEVRVSKPFEDSTLSRIIHLVEEAQGQRAPIQLTVEKFARYYTPVVVIFAALLAIVPPLLLGAQFEVWFYRALVLLVISCPCALVISTPVTLVSALSNAARLGILLKGGAYLEKFSKLEVLAFDKTGTLTFGRPTVQDLVTFNSFTEEEVIKIAVSIESNSEHAVANAIENYAMSKRIQPIKVENFRIYPGLGAEGEISGTRYYIGNHNFFEKNSRCDAQIHEHLKKVENKKETVIILGSGEQILGIFSIADEIRPEAGEVIEKLKKMGIEKTIMLTGDNRVTAAAIASLAGIDECYAALLPEDKVKTIQKLKDKYQHVGMIGDGVNDAPALATATIGISMGVSGSDAAIETSDISLMKDNLFNLISLKKLSHKTVRIIQQNIFISIFLKAVFFILAIPGYATLWMAVFADMGASLIVIFNGLRTLRIKKLS